MEGIHVVTFVANDVNRFQDDGIHVSLQEDVVVHVAYRA